MCIRKIIAYGVACARKCAAHKIVRINAVFGWNVKGALSACSGVPFPRSGVRKKAKDKGREARQAERQLLALPLTTSHPYFSNEARYAG